MSKSSVVDQHVHPGYHSDEVDPLQRVIDGTRVVRGWFNSKRDVERAVALQIGQKDDLEAARGVIGEGWNELTDADIESRAVFIGTSHPDEIDVSGLPSVLVLSLNGDDAVRAIGTRESIILAGDGGDRIYALL